MFINGKFCEAESGKTTAIINPTDETIICHVRFLSDCRPILFFKKHFSNNFNLKH